MSVAVIFLPAYGTIAAPPWFKMSAKSGSEANILISAEAQQAQLLTKMGQQVIPCSAISPYAGWFVKPSSARPAFYLTISPLRGTELGTSSKRLLKKDCNRARTGWSAWRNRSYLIGSMSRAKFTIRLVGPRCGMGWNTWLSPLNPQRTINSNLLRHAGIVPTLLLFQVTDGFHLGRMRRTGGRYSLRRKWTQSLFTARLLITSRR